MVCFQNNVTCTIVGDGMVGKTCLAKAFAGENFSCDYVATVAENYNGLVSAYGDQFKVDIRDTNGQHEDENARSKAIAEADVVVICYNASDRVSYDNVKSFWIHEVRRYNKKKPVILVATQSDSRCENNPEHVMDIEGQILTKVIDAEYYNKCSSFGKTGIKNVFESAVLASIKYKKRKTSIIKRVFGR